MTSLKDELIAIRKEAEAAPGLKDGEFFGRYVREAMFFAKAAATKESNEAVICQFSHNYSLPYCTELQPEAQKLACTDVKSEHLAWHPKAIFEHFKDEGLEPRLVLTGNYNDHSTYEIRITLPQG